MNFIINTCWDSRSVCWSLYEILYYKILVTNKSQLPKNYLYYEEEGPNQFIISACKEEIIFISARKQTVQV